MNIREQILTEHSKENAEAIADWIGTDKSRLKKLIDIFLYDEYRVVQWAAFVISRVADKHHDLLTPHLDSMVARMKEPNLHVAVKRNVLRILQDRQIPEHLHGDIMNLCFDSLANVQEPIAVRVFSMTVLDNLSKQYPEIKQELHAIIEEELQRGASAGFTSRAKKILKRR
ncbi:MAG: hypothetical protein R2800_09650 [Flavipsychrobacter sp.]